MNARIIWKAALGACLAAGLMVAAQAKPKMPKSQGEVDALKAVFAAQQTQNPDATIKAAEDVLAKYADTEFKADLLFMVAQSYQQKGEGEKMQVYAERTLEADPDNYQAMLLLANVIAQRTREFDLDLEEKLAAAEKYAKKAQEVIPKAAKPNPNVSDDQWEAAKKFFAGQSFQALGLISLVRKDFDAAITNFKKGMDLSPSDEGIMTRLGVTYAKAGKFDEAIATFDKVINSADAMPAFKQYAQAERARTVQAKNAKAGGAAAPAQGQPAAQPVAQQPAAQPAEEKKP